MMSLFYLLANEQPLCIKCMHTDVCRRIQYYIGHNKHCWPASIINLVYNKSSLISSAGYFSAITPILLSFFDISLCVMSFVAEAEAAEALWNVRAQLRQASPDLPETVTRLTASDGSLLYLVGTAHFSDSSKQDVSKVG